MNSKALRLFLAVADGGSFSKAEAAEFISKQAVLKQMDALEEEVGVPLFVRSNRGVRLTEAGQEFYRGARDLLDRERKLIAGCRALSDAAKVLRVGNVEHQALLSEVTEAFQAACPDVRIERVIHPNHSGEYRVEHDIMDVAETFSIHPVLKKDTVAYTPLIELPYRAAVREGHPLAGRETVSLADLTPYETMVFRSIIPTEYLIRLEAAFAGAPGNLEVRTDSDNQVPVAFSCLESDKVLLTANYFIYRIPQLRPLPLGLPWKLEYGVITRPDPSPVVKDYVALAVRLFRGKQI